jgi:hypothetical protein
MVFSPPPTDPRRFVSEFRANYVNLHNLWTRIERPPSGVELRTPSERPLSVTDLPDGVRSLLADYTRMRPNARVELTKYLRAVDGEPLEVIEDDRGLPEEDQLITLSRTTTLATITDLHVVTEIFVGRIEQGRAEAG